VTSRLIEIHHATLDDCGEVTGLAVIIDVVRAFTTAAYAFGAGARSITLVSGVDEALQMRAAHPELLVMGEVGGLPPPGFDFGNSPTRLEHAPVMGRDLVQRTGAGTQGAVRCHRANPMFTASFVVAGATVRAIRALAPPRATLVATGHTWGDEDRSCADYLEQHLLGTAPDPGPYLERVRTAVAARHHDPEAYDTLGDDLDRCTRLDAFDFAMRVRQEDGRPVMRRE
jgi:2-phosphosulfolactate phosphatase